MIKWLAALTLFLAGCDDSGTTASRDAGAGAIDARAAGDSAPVDAAPVVEDAAPVAEDAAPPVVDDAGAVAPEAGTLHVAPAHAELTLGSDPPPSQQLRVERRAADGDVTPVSLEEVEWWVDPPDLGSVDFDTGIFTSTGQPGTARVEARNNGDRAEAIIELRAFQDVLDPAVPADVPRRFDDAPSADGCAPALEYPEPLTAFPSNIAGVTFQWSKRGHTLFRASFRAGELSVRFFTNTNELTPDGPPWHALLRAAQGGALQLTLTGLGGAGPSACSAPETSFLIDEATLQGAIYYWSTGDAGIMRLAAGDIEPEHFLTPAVAPDVNCPACHALSRDGTRIAFTRTTFPPFGDLMISSVETPRQAFYDPTGVIGYFPSFAPDGDQIVAGAGGRLVLRAVETGVQLGELPLPEGTAGGSPDWSWQGDRIVAAVAPRNVNPLPDVGLSRAAIYQWLREDGGWGAPAELVTQAGDQNNDRPAYSPDGHWVAFSRSGPNPGQNMGNPGGTIWMVSADGGPPIALARANQGDDRGNAWPKWAPIAGRGRLWLAFSSTRDYGHALINSSVASDDRRPQIWVAGFDPARALNGEDPSSPAFWLPFQSVESGNHIPYWAVYQKE